MASLAGEIPDAVKRNVRAVLLSKIGGVETENFNKDYKALLGEYFPYRKLGYLTLKQGLQALPDVVRFDMKNGKEHLFGIADNSSFMSSFAVKAQYSEFDEKKDRRKRNRDKRGNNNMKKSFSYQDKRSAGKINHQPDRKQTNNHQMPAQSLTGGPASKKYPTLVGNMQGLYALVVAGAGAEVAQKIEVLFSTVGPVIEKNAYGSLLFFRFQELQHAETVLDKFNGFQLGRYTLRVDPAKEKKPGEKKPGGSGRDGAVKASNSARNGLLGEASNSTRNGLLGESPGVNSLFTVDTSNAAIAGFNSFSPIQASPMTSLHKLGEGHSVNSSPKAQTSNATHAGFNSLLNATQASPMTSLHKLGEGHGVNSSPKAQTSNATHAGFNSLLNATQKLPNSNQAHPSTSETELEQTISNINASLIGRSQEPNNDYGLLRNPHNVQLTNNPNNSDIRKPELFHSHQNHVDTRPRQGDRSKQRMAASDADICSLRISNIANSLLEKDVRTFLEPFNPLHIDFKYQKMAHTYYQAIVKLQTRMAERAIQTLNGKIMYDMPLSVRPCYKMKPKPQRTRNQSEGSADSSITGAESSETEFPAAGGDTTRTNGVDSSGDHDNKPMPSLADFADRFSDLTM